MRTTFPLRWQPSGGEWVEREPTFTNASILAKVRMACARGPIIVEHAHYMAGSGPSVLIFENWDDLEKYCDARVFAGDVIDVWQFAETCRPDTRLAENESGGMPVPLIRQTLERTGPVVVEHRARQAVAPERLSFDDAEEFQEYWDSHVRPDDDISVWSYSHVCSLELRVAWGVCPDPDGRTPLQGAY